MHPVSAEGINPAYLNGLIAEISPQVRVKDVEVVEAKTYGEEMV
jgi:hypothetical protein